MKQAARMTAVLLALLAYPAFATPGEDRVTHLLNNEIVPHSYDYQVTNFLRNKGISYTSDNASPPTINATIPRSERYRNKGPMMVIFSFDADKRLTSYIVKEMPVGSNGTLAGITGSSSAAIPGAKAGDAGKTPPVTAVPAAPPVQAIQPEASVPSAPPADTLQSGGEGGNSATFPLGPLPPADSGGADSTDGAGGQAH